MTIENDSIEYEKMLQTCSTDGFSSVYFGTYPYEADGTRRKIEWKILKQQGSRMLLLSTFGIDTVSYNEPIASTWENCTLRQWLNDTFIKNAFSDEEQAAILKTTVPADSNTDYETPAGNATLDKVFLLSISEVRRLFPSNKQRIIRATPYAQKNGACVNDITKTSWWWLRSPGSCPTDAAIVNLFGSVRTDGNYVGAVYDCVRPAIWVDSEKMKGVSSTEEEKGLKEINKEITLVLAPYSLEADIDDKDVEDYKDRVFEAWKTLEKRAGREAHVDAILPTTHAEPISLGQLCLVSYLKKAGIRVNYVFGDYWVKKRNLTEKEFLEYVVNVAKNSCMIGFYAMTPTVRLTLDLMASVKQAIPDSITVLGGPHGTYADADTLENNAFVDVVARGEGERTLLELVNTLCEGDGNLSGIEGITYRDHGTIKRNPDRELMCAEEIPSPDYSVLPRDYECLLTVMYARGCPYTCKFCAENQMWRHKQRFRDPNLVADEISYITQTWNQSVIHICDSEIDAMPSQLEKLLDCIIERNIPCELTVNLRCDAHKRLTPALLEKMKKAGIVAYLIGSESASDRMLGIMGRQAVFSDFLKTVEVLRNANAGYIFPGVMIGFPGETVESIETSRREFLKLLEQGMVDYFFPRVFIPYPGSDPFQHPEKYDIVLSRDWADYVRYGVRPPFETKLLSRQQLKEQMHAFYKELAELMEKKLS